MPLTVNTNVSSLIAQNSLRLSNQSLQQNQERLSTGLRINSAADDAAGLAISDRMTAQIRGMNQAIRNAGDGISLAQTAEGALQEVTDILQRMRELAVQSANASNTDSDRTNLDQEFSAKNAELDRIAQVSSFNNQRILDGSFGLATFQVGANVGETIDVDMSTSMRNSDIGDLKQSVLELTELSNVSSATLSDITGLESNDWTLNDVNIKAPSDNSNGKSSGSAYAIADAINAQSDEHGVTASAKATEQLLDSGSSFTSGLSSGSQYSLTLNGVEVISTDDQSNLKIDTVADAINDAKADTGLGAKVVEDGGGNDVLKLTAQDGRNIEIEESSTSTAVSLVDRAETLSNGQISIFKADLELSGDNIVLESANTSQGNLDTSATQLIDNIYSKTETATSLDPGTADFTWTDTIKSNLDIASVDTASAAETAILKIDEAIDQVDSLRSELGAVQNRFDSTINSLTDATQNLTDSRSRILDADIAKEAAEMTQNNVKRQAASSILAQANQNPTLALQLLGG